MKYTGQFSNINDELIEVNIVTENDTSGVKELTFSGESPVVISQVSSDGIFSPIKSRSCTISVVTKSVYMDMYSASSHGTTVEVLNVTNDNECIFYGYLTPCEYNQSYVYLNRLELEAVDALSTLKDFKYSYVNGDNSSLISIYSILKRGLVNIAGYPGNIYLPKHGLQSKAAHDRNMYPTEGEYISEDVFYDDDPMSWYEVFEEICNFYSLTVVPYGKDVYFIDYESIINYDNFDDYGNTTFKNIIDNYVTQRYVPIKIAKSDYSGDEQNIEIDEVYNKVIVKVETTELEEEDLVIDPIDEASSATFWRAITSDMERSDGELWKSTTRFFEFIHGSYGSWIDSSTRWQTVSNVNSEFSAGTMGFKLTPNFTNRQITLVSAWMEFPYRTGYLFNQIVGQTALISQQFNYQASQKVPSSASWTPFVMFFPQAEWIDRWLMEKNNTEDPVYYYDNPHGTRNYWLNDFYDDHMGGSNPVLIYRGKKEIEFSPADSSTTNFLMFQGDLCWQQNCSYDDVNYHLWSVDAANKYYGGSLFMIRDCGATGTHTCSGCERSPGDTDYNKGWPMLKMKVQIGDKYWNGSSWTTTASTFWIPYHKENVEAGDEELIWSDFNHPVSNLDYTYGVRKDGFAIPITHNDSLYGKIKIDIWMPRIPYSPGVLYGQEVQYQAPWMRLNYEKTPPVIFMKNMAFSLESTSTDREHWYLDFSDVDDEDDDIEYSNEINTNNVEEFDDLTLKVNTYNKKAPISMSYVIEPILESNDTYDIETHTFGFEDAFEYMDHEQNTYYTYSIGIDIAPFDTGDLYTWYNQQISQGVIDDDPRGIPVRVKAVNNIINGWIAEVIRGSRTPIVILRVGNSYSTASEANSDSTGVAFLADASTADKIQYLSPDGGVYYPPLSAYPTYMRYNVVPGYRTIGNVYHTEGFYRPTTNTTEREEINVVNRYVDHYSDPKIVYNCQVHDYIKPWSCVKTTAIKGRRFIVDEQEYDVKADMNSVKLIQNGGAYGEYYWEIRNPGNEDVTISIVRNNNLVPYESLSVRYCVYTSNTEPTRIFDVYDGSDIIVPPGKSLYMYSDEMTSYYGYKMSISDDVEFSGDIMKMLYNEELGVNAFYGFFQDCTHITTAPELPATELSYGCYSHMFEGCTSLRSAPELPATNLVYNCYDEMFINCTSLNFVTALFLTNINYTTDYTHNWLRNVSPTGRFVRNSDATWFRVDDSGIPEGWVATDVYAEQYLQFKAIDDCVFYFSNAQGDPVSYSLDLGVTWNTLNSTEPTPVVPAGNIIMWKSDSLRCSYHVGIGHFGSDGRYTAAGNIMSLIYGDNFRDKTDLAPDPQNPSYAHGVFGYMFSHNGGLTDARYLVLPTITLGDNATSCYYYMFINCRSLTRAPLLRATTLSFECYNSMFYNCTSLTQVPALPATTISRGCYRSMFRGCTSLTQAPALPATTISRDCYRSMFKECTSLTQAPALPASTLCQACYESMFEGCTSLTHAPALPATSIYVDGFSQNHYASMFKGCTSLIYAPSLPMIDLTSTSGCYKSMFQGCTSLTHAPQELPATKLGYNCYESMFEGCTSLTQAPALPATKFKGACECYKSMFKDCTSLTQAPDLNAVYLDSSCYETMFSGCSSLNYVKAIFRTDISNNDLYTYNWLDGVAQTGTFVKNCNATWSRTGSSGIPSGWNVETFDLHNMEKYLSFTRDSSVSPASYDVTFQRSDLLRVSYDEGQTWDELSYWTGSTIGHVYIEPCQCVLFKGWLTPQGTDGIGQFEDTHNANITLAGNIMSLLYGDNAVGKTSLSGMNNVFYALFSNLSVVDASNLILPATTLSDSCYMFMFSVCRKLRTPPVLPATTLTYRCYYGMFAGCESLTQAPVLPATNLAKECYESMFESCTSLTQAPVLPATTLKERCYDGMFNYCTSLTQAPVLPATNLAKECYAYMFSGCTNLNYVKAMFTTMITSSTNYTKYWLSNVSSSGTFVMNRDATWYVRGVSGIPNNWTIQTAS